MIKFDHTKLSVDIVYLKTVTTSLGGSITFVDEKKSTDKKEVYQRLVVPMSVARSFIQRTKKVTRYLKPVLTAVVKYGNLVIALERHPLAGLAKLYEEGLDGKPRRWIPASQRNIQEMIVPATQTTDRQWYFDGRYMYAMVTPTLELAIQRGQHMTSDGRFRKVIATTIDLSNLAIAEALAPSERSCLAFVPSRGAGAISPPIWKNLSDVGASRVKAAKKEAEEADEDDDDDGEDGGDGVPTFTFDTIDTTTSVNLNFTLKAGQEIGKTFGYEHVEPLDLPRLMVELHTVNLPNVPLQIKQTYAVGIKFTHALAWLLGMSRRANTLETYIMMRSLMKYLTKKGIFANNVFDAARVFKDGKTLKDVPLMDLEQLLEQDDQQLSLSAIIEQARGNARARKKNEQDIHQLGGLLNEE
jgi:hypothetical protein